MSCTGCAIGVETILKSQPGVLDAGVNFASSTVWVNFDCNITSPENLRNAFRSIGYDLVIDSNNYDIDAEKNCTSIPLETDLFSHYFFRFP